MKTLEPKDIIEMHIKKFGVEPVITGVNFNDLLDIYENILQAIEDGVPYVEQELHESIST